MLLDRSLHEPVDHRRHACHVHARPSARTISGEGLHRSSPCENGRRLSWPDALQLGLASEAFNSKRDEPYSIKLDEAARPASSRRIASSFIAEVRALAPIATLRDKARQARDDNAGRTSHAAA